MNRVKSKKKKSSKKKSSNFVFLFVIIVFVLFFSIKFISTPKIKIIGDKEIRIQAGESYEEKGANCKAFFKDITQEIKIEGNVDVHKCGEYDIKYTIYAENGKRKSKAIRKVIVYDNMPPTITLIGDNDMTIFKDKEYKEPGYNVTDNCDIDIQDKVNIEGFVDTSKIGEYELIYSAIDSSNNKSQATRKVKVVEITSKLENGLPVLMYHFFYDEKSGEKGADSNFMEVSKFEEQIKYLKDNNFYFPTWEEVEDYVIKGDVLPEKSIVITVDDGNPTYFKYAVPIIKKYNVRATSFVVTSWLSENQLSEYKEFSNLIFESHSHDMHRAGSNGKGRIMTSSHDKIVEDVTISSDIIGKSTVFCYPFGHVNDNAKKALKDAEYTLDFTTKYGRVKPGMDPLELPRIRMSRDDSIASFIKKVS